LIRITCGDTLEELKNIPDESVDLYLQDPPYNVLSCSWEENVIRDNRLRDEMIRTLKPDGTFIFFASGKFTFAIQNYFAKWYKYKYIWVKSNKTNFANAKYMPMCAYEEILVFCKSGNIKKMTYNPQGIIEIKDKKEIKVSPTTRKAYNVTSLYDTYTQTHTGYPDDILRGFKSVTKKKHTSEKPVELLEHLIKTYSNDGELVVDGFAGSFSTGEAAVKLNRSFIGIDKEEKFVSMGSDRIVEALEGKNGEINEAHQ
jgi:site-specific DNA-methyltransferase (adenine-specific)